MPQGLESLNMSIRKKWGFSITYSANQNNEEKVKMGIEKRKKKCLSKKGNILETDSQLLNEGKSN